MGAASEWSDFAQEIATMAAYQRGVRSGHGSIIHWLSPNLSQTIPGSKDAAAAARTKISSASE